MPSNFVGFITQSKRKESVSSMPTLSDLLSVSSGLFSSDVVNGVDREGEGQLIAMCGRLPVGKGFFDGDTKLVGAAMCPACLCGTVTWPLAIMLSADQVPIKSTQSRRCNG